MKFAPKTEEELEVQTLLQPGNYQFHVADASNEKSKNGNEMIKLSLQLWDKDGSTHFVYDYLLEAMSFKLRHFCAVTGLMIKYESGMLDATDCIGKQGHVEIVIKEGKAKDDGSKYPSQNSVKDYKVSTNYATSTNDSHDEDVPF